MKKLLLVTILSLAFLSGCITSSLNYKSTAVLDSSYAHKVTDRNFSAFYNVKELEDKVVVDLALRNDARIFMKNLTITYNECCQLEQQKEGAFNYKNLGNLKNRSLKKVNIILPKENIKRLKLNYSYLPVVEDSFLNNKENYGRNYSESINGFIILYLGR
jgi:hypothetical protein